MKLVSLAGRAFTYPKFTLDGCVVIVHLLHISMTSGFIYVKTTHKYTTVSIKQGELMLNSCNYNIAQYKYDMLYDKFFNM